MWQQKVRNEGRKIEQKVKMKLSYAAVLWLHNKGTAFCLLVLHGVMTTFYGRRGGEDDLREISILLAVDKGYRTDGIQN